MDRRMLLVTCDHAYKEEFIKISLQRSIVVDHVETMNEALKKMAKNEYLLLTICADNVNHLSELNTVHHFREMPILLFSCSEPNTIDPIPALQNGAQVYLISPLNIEYVVETCAAMALFYERIKTREHFIEPMILTYGYLHMSTTTHQVFLKGINITLTKKEFDLLQYFVLNKGLVLTYEQIYNNVWGWTADHSYDDYNVIHRLVSRLRKKLQCVPEVADYITSIWEVGYKFGSL